LTAFPLRSIRRNFGFLGANGAGKTTAMKMLIGISTPTSGEAVVAGYNVKSATEMVKKKYRLYEPKFSMYDDLTVKENITFLEFTV
jgi:ABC-2 type transport system ATP-binding protein